MELGVAIQHAQEVAGMDCGPCAYQHDGLVDLLEELKAYRETGLSPDDCVVLAKAKAEGRLLISPYAVGTEIFVIDVDGKIRKCTVTTIDFSRLASGQVIYSSFNDAAEAALQEGGTE